MIEYIEEAVNGIYLATVPHISIVHPHFGSDMDHVLRNRRLAKEAIRGMKKSLLLCSDLI